MGKKKSVDLLNLQKRRFYEINYSMYNLKKRVFLNNKAIVFFFICVKPSEKYLSDLYGK